MQVTRSKVIDLLRIRGEMTKVDDAERDLPVEVDTERDAEILARLGLDTMALQAGLEDVALDDPSPSLGSPGAIPTQIENRE